jgi:hypothetical protein
MAHSKAKLKSSGDKASHCIRSGQKHCQTKCLLIRTLLHISISLTSSMGNPNSTRILYNTSLLTESQTFLKSSDSSIVDVLSHYTPIFSTISDECKISDQ